jgi:hypothetical protein
LLCGFYRAGLFLCGASFALRPLAPKRTSLMLRITLDALENDAVANRRLD